MNAWTNEKLEQFKALLKTIPSEDVALMTAKVWCKEFDLKFDDNDDFIARRWHRFFHRGSLSADNRKYAIQIKDGRGNWMNVKEMSTKADSIWLCVYREDSFLEFKEMSLENWKMAKSYANALENKGHKVRILLV